MYIHGVRNSYYPYDPYNFHYLAMENTVQPLLVDRRATVAFRSVGPHLGYMDPTDAVDAQTDRPSYLVCSVHIPKKIKFSEAVVQRFSSVGTQQWLRLLNKNRANQEVASWVQNAKDRDPTPLELYVWVAQFFVDAPTGKGFINKARDRHSGLSLEDLSLSAGKKLIVLGEEAALPENTQVGVWRRHDSVVSVLMGAAQLEETLAFRTGLSVEECSSVLQALRQALIDMQLDAASLGLSEFTYILFGFFQIKGLIKRGKLTLTGSLLPHFRKLVSNQVAEWRESLYELGEDVESGDSE